ncbi:MAG: hypothetical protein WC197_04665 [Candidatus Gastranaerophilaceae bacterium]|jgi:hypothetical protein
MLVEKVIACFLILIFTTGCTQQNTIVRKKSIAFSLGLNKDHSISQTRTGVYVLKYSSNSRSNNFDPFYKMESRLNKS